MMVLYYSRRSWYCITAGYYSFALQQEIMVTHCVTHDIMALCYTGDYGIALLRMSWYYVTLESMVFYHSRNHGTTAGCHDIVLEQERVLLKGGLDQKTECS